MPGVYCSQSDRVRPVSVATGRCVAASHSRTVSSMPADASTLPSGLNATAKASAEKQHALTRPDAFGEEFQDAARRRQRASLTPDSGSRTQRSERTYAVLARAAGGR